MTLHTITVQLPESLFAALRDQAASQHRSIEEQIIAGITSSLATEDNNAIGGTQGLDELSNEQLWHLAESRLSDAEARRAEELNYKQQAVGLTPDERAELMRLVDETDACVLTRARALAQLTQRGVDISPLLQPVSRSG
jgi:plasmid stability protein